jgi:hypothetical protein
MLRIHQYHCLMIPSVVAMILHAKALAKIGAIHGQATPFTRADVAWEIS